MKTHLRNLILAANRHFGICVFTISVFLRIFFETPYKVIYWGILAYAVCISFIAYFISTDRELKWLAPFIGSVIICIPLLFGGVIERLDKTGFQ